MVRWSVDDTPESEAVARSGTVGVAGAATSMVTTSTPVAGEMLPATSVAVAVIECDPAASTLDVMDQLPALSAATVPMSVTPSKSLTVANASDVPVNVGVVSDVMLSVEDEPESLAVVRSSAPGAAGAAVSTVIVSALDDDDVFEPTVAVTVMAWAPMLRAGVVKVHTPEPLAVTVPMSVAPS